MNASAQLVPALENAFFCNGNGKTGLALKRRTVTWKDVLNRTSTPSIGPKDKCPWVIFSTYHDTKGAPQREHGRFYVGVMDVDTKFGTFAELVAKLRGVFPTVEWLAYTTSSATPEAARVRVLFPLQRPVDAARYEAGQCMVQRYAPADLDEAGGRLVQKMFLPNKLSADAYYETHYQAGSDRLDYHSLDPSVRRATPGSGIAMELPNDQRPEGAYALAHDLETELTRYGYHEIGGVWLSPNSTTKCPGVTLLDAHHWHSWHGSDLALGIGRVGPAGGCWGDAFDLMCHYRHGGDAEPARAEAREYMNLVLVSAVSQQPLAAPPEEGWQFCASDIDPRKVLWSTPFPGCMSDLCGVYKHNGFRDQPELAIAAALVGMSACVAAKFETPESGSCALYVFSTAASGEGKGEAKSIAQAAGSTTDLTGALPGSTQLCTPVPMAAPVKLCGDIVSVAGLEDAIYENGTTSLWVQDEAGGFFRQVFSNRTDDNKVALVRRLFDEWSRRPRRPVQMRARGDNPTRKQATALKENCALVWFSIMVDGDIKDLLASKAAQEGLLGRVLFMPGRVKPAYLPDHEEDYVPWDAEPIYKHYRPCLQATPVTTRWAPGAYALYLQWKTYFRAIADPLDPNMAVIYSRAAENLQRIATILSVMTYGRQQVPDSNGVLTEGWFVSADAIQWAGQLVTSSCAALRSYVETATVSEDLHNVDILVSSLRKCLDGAYANTAEYKFAIHDGYVCRGHLRRACKTMSNRAYDDALRMATTCGLMQEVTILAPPGKAHFKRYVLGSRI